MALLHTERLSGVHTKLCQIVRLASERCGSDILVVEGVRSMAKQREYFQAGKSRTMHSRHLTGHAVDLCPVFDGRDHWDPEDFVPIAAYMKGAARDLGLAVEWGGDWDSFKDMPHFQIPLLEADQAAHD